MKYMLKKVIALITLTILAAGTVLYYNSSIAMNKYTPIEITGNNNIPTTTGVEYQNEISKYFIASAGPAVNQVYPTSDLVNSRAWYQVIYTTGTTAAIKQVEVDFPPGTNIADAKLLDAIGLGPGTYKISGQAITYTLAPEVLVPANTELRLQYDNVLNPSIPDANLTVHIITKDTTGSTIDSGTSQAYKIRQIGTEDISNKSITREKIEPGAVVPIVNPRSSEVVSIPPQRDQSAIAVCSTGEVATGGGYITNSPNVTVTFSSLGDQPRPSWVIHAVNNDTVAHDITATVICLHLSP